MQGNKYKKTYNPYRYKGNKYKNVKTEVDGILFDSKKEANRYYELKLLEKAGEISDLSRQVPFIIVPKSEYGRELKYVADFAYKENGEMVVEDVKSPASRTPVYMLKKRLIAERYGIVIKEI